MTERYLHTRTERFKNDRGVILFVVLLFTATILLGSVLLLNTTKRSLDQVNVLARRQKARHIAEAGLNHALKRLENDPNLINAGLFPFGNPLGDGDYNVTVSAVAGINTFLVSSLGTYENFTSTASATIALDGGAAPINAFDYTVLAGQDVIICQHFHSGWKETGTGIRGRVHANRRVFLTAPDNGRTSIAVIHPGASATSPAISAGNMISLGVQAHEYDGFDSYVYVQGQNNDFYPVHTDQYGQTHIGTRDQNAADLLLEPSTLITVAPGPHVDLPVFDYNEYEDLARSSNSYYGPGQAAGGQVVFDGTAQSGGKIVLNPDSGVVYVDSRAVFYGVVEIHGGLIANNIFIGSNAVIRHFSEGTRNVIVAKEHMEIRQGSELTTQGDTGLLLMAGKVKHHPSDATRPTYIYGNITLMARNDVCFNSEFPPHIWPLHQDAVPFKLILEGLVSIPDTGSGSGQSMRILSWN